MKIGSKRRRTKVEMEEYKQEQELRNEAIESKNNRIRELEQ